MTHLFWRWLWCLAGLVLAAGIAGAQEKRAATGWVNVTGNVGGDRWGYAGVTKVWAVPGSGRIIAGVSEAGLWGSDDGGKSWAKLGAGDGEQIRNRPHQMVFDPKDDKTFWESGSYGPSPFVTHDGGKSFARLGKLEHLDGIGVDFTDPARKTLVVGRHEQARSLQKSVDGGRTWEKIGDKLPENSNHSSDVIVLDGKTYICNAAGWAPKLAWGIFRTEDGGQTWGKMSELGPSGVAVAASDGGIYWGVMYGNGVLKSADGGKTWKKLAGPVKSSPIDLGDKRIAALAGEQVWVSSDGGEKWEKLGPAMPFKANGIVYSPVSKCLYAWKSTDKKVAEAVVKWELGR